MKRPLSKSYDFFALCAWMVTSLIFAVDPIWHYGAFLNDFRGYYAAAYVFRNGSNPYDYFQTSRALLEITGYMGNNPYYYVPWVAWAFTPLTFLPFRISFLIWNGINLVLWIIGLRQIKVLLHIPYSGWRLYALYFVVTLSFAWVTFRFGQIGFLIMIFMLSALIAAQSEKWTQSGVWLALCLIKPNVTIVPVAAICLWLLLKRVWNPIIVVVSINVLLLIFSLIVMPKWYEPLAISHAFDAINYDTDGPGNLIRDRINPTMMGVMKVLNVNHKLALSFYAAAIVFGFLIIILTVQKAKSVLDVALISFTLWLLLTPYAQTSDYIILVVVFVFLANERIKPPIIKIFGLLVISIAPLFGTTPLNSYVMVVYLAGLLALYYIQRQQFSPHSSLTLPASNSEM